MLQHQRQEVTGVVVNRRVQAPRPLRRWLRQEIYFVKKIGMESHEARKAGIYANRANHLRGVAEFGRFLSPNDRDAAEAIRVLGRVKYPSQAVP